MKRMNLYQVPTALMELCRRSMLLFFPVKYDNMFLCFESERIGFIDRPIIWGLSLSEAFSALTVNDIKITVNLNLPCA